MTTPKRFSVFCVSLTAAVDFESPPPFSKSAKRPSPSNPRPLRSFFLTNDIIGEFSGAKRCISCLSPPPGSSVSSSRASLLTFGPTPWPSRQPIFLSSFTPIVSPVVLKTSIIGSFCNLSSAVEPRPANASVVCSFLLSSASATSSSSMKSSGLCCIVGASFLRLFRDEINWDGVQPSLDPTVLKYLGDHGQQSFQAQRTHIVWAYPALKPPVKAPCNLFRPCSSTTSCFHIGT